MVFHDISVFRYTRSIGISIIGASVWAFNKLTWTWSTTVEVFSLNNLCIAALLYLMAEFERVDADEKLRVFIFSRCFKLTRTLIRFKSQLFLVIDLCSHTCLTVYKNSCYYLFIYIIVYVLDIYQNMTDFMKWGNFTDVCHE